LFWKISRLLLIGLLALSFPVQAWAGGVLDVNGDGVHVDDIIKYVNANGGKINKSELLQLTDQIQSVASPGITTGTVRGMVVDHDNAPIAGARVTVEGTGKWANSSSLGEFEIINVPVAFGVRVIVQKDGYSDGQSSIFNVMAGKTVQLDKVQINHLTGTLTGLVIDPNHQPVQQATVRVTGKAEPQQTSTGSDGRFRIDGVHAGSQSVSVIHAVYGTGTKTVEVNAGITTDITIQLMGSTTSQYGSLRGFVYESNGGPVAGAHVTVLNSTYSSNTTVTGAYSIENIPYGTHTLTVSASEFTTKSGLAVTINSPGPTVYETVYLSRQTPVGVTITGKVVTSAGSPVANAAVKLKDHSGSVRDVTTGTDGSYTFAGIQLENHYTLSAASSGYADSASYDFFVESSSASKVLPDIQLLAMSEVGTVTGVVTDGDTGTAMAGVEVHLSYMSMSDSEEFYNYFEAVSNAAGEFSFPFVEGGRYYEIVAAYPGYEGAAVGEHRVTAGETRTEALSMFPLPVVSSIDTNGAEVTVHFSTPIYHFGGIEAPPNPWDGIIVIHGTGIEYAETNVYDLSPDQKDLTLRFNRNLQNGDRLTFTDTIRSENDVYMEPVVYTYTGSEWFELLNAPNDSQVEVNPISKITTDNDARYLAVTGTANDPQGVIFVGDVRVSLKNETTGKYLVPYGGFTSDTEVFEKAFVSHYSDQAQWIFFTGVIVPNGQYTVHAIVESADPVKGNKTAAFTVEIKPAIVYASPSSVKTNQPNVLQVYPNNSGTLYLIHEDLPATSAAELEAAVNSQPDKAIKKTDIVKSIESSMSTTGLIAGRYVLYLVDDTLLLSNPVSIQLVEHPTAGYRLNPWYGMLLPTGYYSYYDSFQVTSDLGGKAYVVPEHVTRANLKGYIEASGLHKVSDVWAGLSGAYFYIYDTLPPGGYRFYTVDTSGEVSESASQDGISIIRFQTTEVVSLYGIQYLISKDMENSLQIGMLYDALENVRSEYFIQYQEALKLAKETISPITDEAALKLALQSVIDSTNEGIDLSKVNLKLSEGWAVFDADITVEDLYYIAPRVSIYNVRVVRESLWNQHTSSGLPLTAEMIRNTADTLIDPSKSTVALDASVTHPIGSKMVPLIFDLKNAGNVSQGRFASGAFTITVEDVTSGSRYENIALNSGQWFDYMYNNESGIYKVNFIGTEDDHEYRLVDIKVDGVAIPSAGGWTGLVRTPLPAGSY
jgi:hypothetical protein